MFRRAQGKGGSGSNSRSLVVVGARFLAAAVLLAAMIYFAWHWITVLRFYAGPSEATLAETGFDLEAARSGSLAGAYAFAPRFPFWSDGATKERFIYLPEGTRIDTSDPDRWNFAEGTRIWKVFTRDGTLVETRMLFKSGPEPWAWDMAVYQPDQDSGVSAKLALAKTDVAGTSHDIPSPTDCVSCHGSGEQRQPLGVTAIQLPWSSQGTLSVETLVRQGLLTSPPAEPVSIPGDELTRAALGYLHANCGSCHYEGSTEVQKEVPLRMNLTLETLESVESTNVYQTAVGHEPHLPGLGTNAYVVPGAPEGSFAWQRMKIRDDGGWQMPPLATEIADEEGVKLIERWILALENPGDSQAGDDEDDRP